MNLYLNNSSQYYLTQKPSVLYTLMNRARKNEGKEHMEQEMKSLKGIFQQDGYKQRDIEHSLEQTDIGDGRRLAVLPYCSSISNRGVLKRVNIKTAFHSLKKISQCMQLMKDSLGLRVPVVYKIPCVCGSSYIGQTGRSIAVRCKEHQRYFEFEAGRETMTNHGCSKNTIFFFMKQKSCSSPPHGACGWLGNHRRSI